MRQAQAVFCPSCHITRLCKQLQSGLTHPHQIISGRNTADSAALQMKTTSY